MAAIKDALKDAAEKVADAAKDIRHKLTGTKTYDFSEQQLATFEARQRAALHQELTCFGRGNVRAIGSQLSSGGNGRLTGRYAPGSLDKMMSGGWSGYSASSSSSTASTSANIKPIHAVDEKSMAEFRAETKDDIKHEIKDLPHIKSTVKTLNKADVPITARNEPGGFAAAEAGSGGGSSGGAQQEHHLQPFQAEAAQKGGMAVFQQEAIADRKQELDALHPDTAAAKAKLEEQNCQLTGRAEVPAGQRVV